MAARAKSRAAKGPRGRFGKIKTPMPEETSKRSSGSLEWIKECAAKIEVAEARARETFERTETRAAEEAEKTERKEGVKRGRGRPSDYRDWMCEEVIKFGLEGMEIVEFAVALQVCRDTLYEWADKHPEFSDALIRAREAAEAHHTRNIRGQARLPAQATNLAGYLGYMKCRFAGWRDIKDDGAGKAVPISQQIMKGRERAAAAAREASAREAGI